MKHDLNNKVVLIAGGAKNLGGLVARDFAKSGAKGVVVHYHSDATKADALKTVAEIEALGVKAYATQGDLTQVDQVVRLFDEAVERMGGVDIAINTAGLVIKKAILDVNEHDYDQSFAINAKAAFFFIQQAGRTLNDGGKIITIVSSLLAAYTDGYSIYPGSKASVEHFTRAASKEFGHRGISVNAIGPGPMDTPFFYGQETKEAVAYLSNAAALSQYSKTGLTDIEDIAPIAKFLATEGWWMTGQTIFPNGGFTTR